MERKIEDWENTCERFVAFLDIMGFRDRVFREKHEDVLKMLESLYPAIDTIKRWAGERPDKKETQSKTHVVFPVSFSDSIILISSDDSPESAYKILLYTIWILNEAIMEGIPLKGAVAHGEQTADPDKSVFFGKPLIDAYELQKELQLYGAVIHHTMEKHITNLNTINSLEKDNYVFKYNVPMKSCKITHYMVGWFPDDIDEKRILDLGTKLYVNVSGTPRLYVDNTIDCIRWRMKTSQQRK